MTYDELNHRLAEIDVLKQKLGAEYLVEHAKPLFEKFPDMQNFSWRQGEYFNDEETKFRAFIDAERLAVNGVAGDDVKVDVPHGDYRDYAARSAYFSAKRQAMNCHVEVETLLASILGRLEELFGDHVKVTVHRDGRVQFEEYHFG